MDRKLLSLYALVMLLGNIECQPCPNSCNGQGLCLSPVRVCKCFAGFEGADCSLKSCPKGIAWADHAKGVDNAHNLAPCSNMGICDTLLGVCICQRGFEGSACQRKSCPLKCNNAGKCLSMSQYAQSKDAGSGIVYAYDSIWDAHKIYGCVCDVGYYGPACTLRRCPRGDDPLTGNSQNTLANPIQVNEIQGVVCKASAGFFTLSFQGKTTQRIPYNAKFDPEGQQRIRTPGTIQSYLEALPNIGALGTIVISTATQACLDTVNGASWTVEFVQNFGVVPLLVPHVTGTLTTAAQNAIVVSRINVGTKENLECSNRGICNSITGICTCSTNFDTSNGYNQPGTRGDCGYATKAIQFCPGVVSCSGHGLGQCPGAPTYKCTCIAGWTGADCSLRTCPTGVSWFTLPSGDNQAHLFELVECSDMGTCDRSSGNCVCTTGFYGDACQFMSCPGVLVPCNGFGTCKDMNKLAALAEVDGQLAGYTYGVTPNNPVTWDAFKVQGCYCDSNHTGYDCSQLKCPYGDDPVTSNQFDETQLLSCSANTNSGFIVLSFRGKSSVSIPTASTADEVAEYLSAVPGMGRVVVDLLESNLPNFLCTPSGAQKFVVTFKTLHGDLPLIKLQSSVGIPTGSFVISEYVKGTKEYIECSGRGLCDRATGLCDCFQGFQSSDGQGKQGKLGDCGYVELIYVNQAY